MNKIFALKNLEKKTIFFIFVINFITTYKIIENYSNYLEPFEDEITSLLSGLAFISNLNFDGSPLIVGNYSPYLTSGPLASIGSAMGWKISGEFVISRLFNFYISVIILFLLFVNIEIKKLNNNQFLKLNILLFSIFLLPWWFGVLYSLGEVISSTLFALSVLLINKKTNLSLFLMGLTVVFGKTLQILLLIPFVGLFFLFNKKIEVKNIFFILLPFLTYLMLLYFKVDDFDMASYFKEYFTIINEHQSSGVDTVNLGIFQNFLANLTSSEFNQWTMVTKLRVMVSPLIFCMIMVFESKNLNESKLPSLPLSISILFPYFWFIFISDTKWIRYSQHFLYLVIIFSILLILSEFKISQLSHLFIFINLSIFMSSTTVFLMYLLGVLVIKNKSIFKNYFLIVLLVNSLNIMYESNKLDEYDLNFQNCKNNIRTIDCVNEYLQY